MIINMSFVPTLDISGEQFLLTLCKKTQLKYCDKVAKEFKGILENAKRYGEYSKEVSRIRLNEKTEYKMKMHILSSTRVAEAIINENALKGIEDKLTDVDTKEEFKNLVKTIVKASTPQKTWLSRIYDTFKDITKYIWDIIEGIATKVWKSASKCLQDYRCLTFLAIALWIVYCRLYGTTTVTNEGGWGFGAANPGEYPMPIYRPAQNVSQTSEPCQMTWNLLEYIKEFFVQIYSTLKQGFLSMFGLNDDYIIPTNINYMASAEEWDKTLFRVGTNVASGVGCGGASYFAGVGASLASTGVGLAPGALVGGTALVLGSLCYGASSLVNTGVIDKITKEQYLQYERLLVRPFIIELERKIFNFAVENVSEEKREQLKTLNGYFLQVADLVTGIRAFTVNLGKIVKDTYGKVALSGAQAAFTTAQNKLDQHKKLMENQNKLMIQKQELVRDRLIVEASQYFKKIKWNRADTFSNDTKLTILLHLVHVGLIDRDFVKRARKGMRKNVNAISEAFDSKQLLMMAFFANNSVELKSRREVPNLKF
tara:strand:+ start:514 stop:2133 length:1620 start_codon:yes stop_codon:yes gene_type:complete